jgi:hypothetical protein
MRNLTDHIVPGDSANHQLSVGVLDEPGQGGACHLYEIRGFNTESNVGDIWKERYGKPSDHTTMLFQNGPIKEVGVNGVTHEALLAILIDRMRLFQAGPYACDANQRALDKMEGALSDLQERTKARIARGVEGTHAA